MRKPKEITKATRVRAYSVSQALTGGEKQELKLNIPFDVYMQDPHVARENAMFGINENLVRWEPGISDGPTSARFAVVDYNNDNGHLARPAIWDKDAIWDQDDKGKGVKTGAFVFPDSRGNRWILDRNNSNSLQFDQVHVWAVLQRALEYFEEGAGLGRPIPFGFEGNRLIVVPHAGYGENAYYDRESKSLQFYYFDDENGNRINTCLSTDIVNHEFGHALLDGVRPYLYESSLIETGAFHESIGDLTAILLLLKNGSFRDAISKETGADLSEAKRLGNIAEQFGTAVTGKPYLRSAREDEDEEKLLTMKDVTDADGPHQFSLVLTRAMFDILLDVSDKYIKRKQTAKQAFANACLRMQRMAIQPLDLLPPVDVTFRDYALAVLRAEEIANPTDPHEYCETMLNAFVRRKILSRADAREFREPRYVFNRLQVDVRHSVEDISRSRAAAYRFLNDNREQLFIPAQQDVVVADLYDAKKTTRQGLQMPRQYILEYIWREEIELKGPRFGIYEGEVTSMLCGGTLVIDENGNVLSWFRKPGTENYGRRFTSSARSNDWKAERVLGRRRQRKFLSDLAKRIKSGMVGSALGSALGMLGTHIPPMNVEKQDGLLKFTLSPHLCVAGEDHEHFEGGRRWEVSS